MQRWSNGTPTRPDDALTVSVRLDRVRVLHVRNLTHLYCSLVAITLMTTAAVSTEQTVPDTRPLTTAPSDALVLFGATGDLAYKQIFPALQQMVRRENLDVPIIGVVMNAFTLLTFLCPSSSLGNPGHARILAIGAHFATIILRSQPCLLRLIVVRRSSRIFIILHRTGKISFGIFEEN